MLSPAHLAVRLGSAPAPGVTPRPLLPGAGCVCRMSVTRDARMSAGIASAGRAAPVACSTAFRSLVSVCTPSTPKWVCHCRARCLRMTVGPPRLRRAMEPAVLGSSMFRSPLEPGISMRGLLIGVMRESTERRIVHESETLPARGAAGTDRTAAGACAAPTPAPAAAAETAVGEAAQSVQDTKANAALINTAWQLESFYDGPNAVPVVPGTAPTLGFGVDRYSGFGGCDFFMGTYLLRGDSLSLDPPAKTTGGCINKAKAMDQQGTSSPTSATSSHMRSKTASSSCTRPPTRS